jgi:hypothetical protein
VAAVVEYVIKGVSGGDDVDTTFRPEASIFMASTKHQTKLN